MAEALRQDDPSIQDTDLIWRRIPPWDFFLDENLGRTRPSSAAFDDDPGGQPMSVVIVGEATTPENVLAGHPGFALAAIPVSEVRACGLGVVRDPLPSEPAHALMIGRKTKSIRSRLARAATWVVPPRS